MLCIHTDTHIQLYAVSATSRFSGYIKPYAAPLFRGSRNLWRVCNTRRVQSTLDSFNLLADTHRAVEEEPGFESQRQGDPYKGKAV